MLVPGASTQRLLEGGGQGEAWIAAEEGVDIPPVLRSVSGEGGVEAFEGMGKALPALREACRWSLDLLLSMGL